jgi:translation initiation factor IF-1
MTVEGVVVELMPHQTFRVKLENEALVLAHTASAAVRNFERIRPGDRVEVEMAPHDPTRGRITRLLAK